MEGPSLVILRDELQPFLHTKIIDATGSTKLINIEKLKGNTLNDVKSWGKHLLLKIGEDYIRIHFLMYGSYRINEQKDSIPRLSLKFDSGEFNLYSCSIREITPEERNKYDWSVDIMSSEWNQKKVINLVKAEKETRVDDILMNQAIFAGVGNIIKNEVLYELRLNPNTLIKDLSSKEIKKLVEETRAYCFKFFEWKKIFVLKKHWKIFRKRMCPRCGSSVIKAKTGKSQRWSFYCPHCQQAKANILINSESMATF